MKAAELMTNAACIGSGDTLAHARRLMLRSKCKHLLVMDGEKLVGILTVSDILSRMTGGSWRRRPVDNLLVETTMNKKPYTVPPDADEKMLAKLMLEKDISIVPVVAKGKVQGVVTKEPLLQHFAENYKGKLKVSDIMSRKVATVKPANTVAHAMGTLSTEGRSRLVVEHDGVPVGIISSKDIFFSSFTQEPPLVKDVMVPARTIAPGDDAASVAAEMLKRGESCLPVVDEKLAGILTRTDCLKALR